MTQQVEHDEECLNCNDPLLAGDNWNLIDVKTNLLYCIKQACQESKSIVIQSRPLKPSERTKKKQPADKGLLSEIKPSRRFIKNPPDPVRVARFAEMLKDPDTKNEKGMSRYSKILKKYGIYNFKTGFETAEIAVAQFPNEVDLNGCPSYEAVNAVKNYLKRMNKRFNGNLEVYSTKGVKEDEPHKGKKSWRWHTLKDKEDLDKQTGTMREIAKNIELAAKKREVNFDNTTYEQRMEKVGILDQFFDQGA